MPTFHRAASLSDLPPGEKIAVTINSIEIALFNHADAIHAFEDLCPHAGAPLSDMGACRGDRLLCILHGASFDLATGESSGPPAFTGLRVFKTRVEGQDIFVELP